MNWRVTLTVWPLALQFVFVGFLFVYFVLTILQVSFPKAILKALIFARECLTLECVTNQFKWTSDVVCALDMQ